MAAVYANGMIPALDPLASGAIDNAAAAVINAGQNLDGADVTAATRQHTSRKRLAMLDPPLATSAEVVSSKRRKHKVQSAHFDGPPAVPAWAQQMQDTLTRVELKPTGVEQQTRFLLEDNQRSKNRSRRNATDPIQPLIRTADGQLPVHPHLVDVVFPANQIALEDMKGPQLNRLLTFYGLGNNGSFSEKLIRLMQHLGI
jgi:hypothetical protein